MSYGRGAKKAAVLVAVAAIGLGTAVYLKKRDEEPLTKEEASASDASVDAKASTAKGKPPPKKKAARGGKLTRITPPNRGGGTGGAPHPAHTAAAHAPTAGNAGNAGNAHEAPNNNIAPPDEAPAEPAAPRPAPHRHYGPSGPSYESVVDSNNHEINMGGHAGADLSDAQLSGPMGDGSFISDCGAPDNMGVTVKVAIKSGHAVGVSVSTSPHSGDVAHCIEHHVRGLSWPSSPKLDSFITTY